MYSFTINKENKNVLFEQKKTIVIISTGWTDFIREKTVELFLKITTVKTYLDL